MPTKHQLAKLGRKKKFRRCVVPYLCGGPQRFVVASKILIRAPRKPNSAKRQVVRVRLKYKGKFIYCRLPGSGKDLNEGALLLMRGGGSKDLAGINYTLVRGALSFTKVEQFGRRNRRSKFGTKLDRNPRVNIVDLNKEMEESVEWHRYILHAAQNWHYVIPHDHFY